MIITETAYAKINLALHIRGKNPDGYHDLESVFAFAQDGDILDATPADGLTLRVTGPFSAGLCTDSDNLVMRAAVALRAIYPSVPGASLHLDKRLPVASGIGGGSADAAAALRLLARLWDIDAGSAEVAGIARNLGADVPACLTSHTRYGKGRGDQLSRVTIVGISRRPVLLVNPRIALSTAAVFAQWDGVDHGALDPLDYHVARNDLTAPAIRIVPEIDDILLLLNSLCGVRFARMSGSGATCFALFETVAARNNGAKIVQQAMPHAWCLASELR